MINCKQLLLNFQVETNSEFQLFNNNLNIFFRQEVDILARQLGCKLIRTSVKDDVNVNNVFRFLATRCLIEIQKEEQEYMSGNGLHQTYTIGKTQ